MATFAARGTAEKGAAQMMFLFERNRRSVDEKRHARRFVTRAMGVGGAWRFRSWRRKITRPGEVMSSLRLAFGAQTIGSGECAGFRLRPETQRRATASTCCANVAALVQRQIANFATAKAANHAAVWAAITLAAGARAAWRTQRPRRTIYARQFKSGARAFGAVAEIVAARRKR